MPHRLKPDPLGVPRNPLAVYLLCLALVSGALLLVGVTTSQSVESSLPRTLAALWGGELVFGSGITLIGMYWQGTVSFGLLCKKIGMFTLTVASLVYAAVVAVTYGMAGLFTTGVVVGFGLACAIQYRNLNARVKAIIREGQGRRGHDR